MWAKILPWLFGVSLLFGAGFGAGWHIQAERVQSAKDVLAIWKAAAQKESERAERESKRRHELRDQIQKRLDRINAGQVSTKVRIEDRYVYLPDNASCVVRLPASRDEPTTIADIPANSPAAVLDVSGIRKAYEQCREQIRSLDGAEGRIVIQN